VVHFVTVNNYFCEEVSLATTVSFCKLTKPDTFKLLMSEKKIDQKLRIQRKQNWVTYWYWTTFHKHLDMPSKSSELKLTHIPQLFLFKCFFYFKKKLRGKWGTYRRLCKLNFWIFNFLITLSPTIFLMREMCGWSFDMWDLSVNILVSTYRWEYAQPGAN